MLALLTPGAEIVKQAAERGAIVAINYAASKDRAEELCKSLPGSGHVVIQGDAFTHEGCDSIVAEATKALGGLDSVVSNQGATKFASWADLSESPQARWIPLTRRVRLG
jgi:NAD(P)-dependent dehydrogenase (short-subunit alcohol dehydrogenase family)